MKIRQPLKILELAWRLGLFNVFRFIFFRFKILVGWFLFKSPKSLPDNGILFREPIHTSILLPKAKKQHFISEANLLKSGRNRFFASEIKFVDSPPKWRQWNEKCYNLHWSKVAINVIEGQDIKKTWELSRFHWMPLFAAAFLASKEKSYILVLNDWFSDWAKSNIPNAGVNWVNGQEISIRLINIVNASFLLGIQKANVTSTLLNTLEIHCQRIMCTLDYALSQDNNHGISESAALYIAGNWLKTFCSDKKRIKRGELFSEVGRKTLERLSVRLIAEDGGFSMASFSYHRSVLDTFSIVEFWRRELNLTRFSPAYYNRVSRLAKFLFQVHDIDSGDVPNIGANDGSLLYLLALPKYRDFRPSIQLASSYYCDTTAFKHEKTEWFSADLPKMTEPQWKKRTSFFSQSGFVSLVPEENINTWAILKIPTFKFRPLQSDGLHFDLWFKGRNILSDTGTYSYNCNRELDEYFSGAAGHNVVQFDRRESMFRLGKFLWGAWPKVEFTSNKNLWIEKAEYICRFKDYLGATHERKIKYVSGKWIITDKVSGKFKNSVLRWHLEGLDWTLKQDCLKADKVEILVKSDKLIQLKLVSGWKSLHYGQKISIPVLEITADDGPTTIQTEIKLQR